MKPAPRNDAVAWAAKRLLNHSHHAITRTIALIDERLPELVEFGGRAYVADAFASVWCPGMFRDALIEKSAGLADVRALHRLAIRGPLWTVVAAYAWHRRKGQVVQAASAQACLGRVCVVAGVGVDDMVDDLTARGFPPLVAGSLFP